MQENRNFLIGQLAEKVGVSTDTVRYYEKEGLIRSNRHTNNYRIYSESDLKKLGFISEAQDSGFTLREIKELLSLINEGRRNCSDYENVAKQKIKEIESKIKVLEEYKNSLISSLKCCSPETKECKSLPFF
ncbi:MerR family transcriptional regulator [Leptospira koniambonensis]|uniref:MerR family transcriptional regulator n=1 Tax=Leptospira koniambonensis TaxID=2484950 RepID=A0A4R9J2F0_9LEPT|nr:MerR family transcriptional regulator [Leptospira koniambonensis]TGL28176.1 MerR family transcriptional regulator [Leptospira koniambonensis]